MGVFQTSVLTACLLAIQCQVGQAIPFNGQARAITTTTIGNYTYQGCYAEPSSGRALESVVSNTQMTREMCATICAASTKSKYFGVEYGKECWCGNTLSTQATLANSESECSSKCAGNATEFCGAGSRLNLFMNANIVLPSAPAPKQTVGDYAYKGCYTDNSSNGRALSTLSASDAMTIELCATFAQSRGYKYFGVEYGRECWAGNTLSQYSAVSTASCSMSCKGDSSETCGGSGLMNLYMYSPVVSSSTSTSTSVASTSSSQTSQASSTPVTSVQIQTTTTSTSGPISTDPVSDGTGVIDLAHADVFNAQIVEENGKVVIVMDPPSNGGNASIHVPASPPADIAPGTEIVVRAEIRAEVLKKRAVLTECTLTMYLGGIQIYSNTIWTSDGNYTTVTSMPAAAEGAATLIIVEYCPGDAATVTVGGVAIGLPAAGSTTSLSLSSTDQSTPSETLTSSDNPSLSTLPGIHSTVTSTQPTEQTTIYPPSTALPPTAPMTSGPNSEPTTSTISSLLSSSTPLGTSSLPAGMTSAPSVVTYSAPSYTADACSQPTYGPANCMVSGAPVATSGLVAVATGVPVPEGPLIEAFRTCARVCGSIDDCNSYALDRGNWPSDTTSDWTCYFYSGYVEDYAVSYDPAYSAVVYFESGCYTCDPLDDDEDGSGGSSLTSSSQVESLTTTSPPALITTAPPGINTYAVAPYTASTCTRPNGYYSCILSGAPVATSGLLGEATGVPVPTGGSMDQAYEQCAGICDSLPDCDAWALDRGAGVYPSSQLDSWTCYFYSGSVSSYAVSYMSQYSAVVWFGNGCYDCDPQDLAVVEPSSSTLPLSSSIPQASTFVQTSDTATTSLTPTTSPPVITSAAVLTTSAPAYAPVCTYGMGDECVLSGAPVQTSGLVAVATGVPATPVGSNEGFEKQYTICARVCGEIETCESFALDRGSWPTVLDDWTCYFYSGGVREYAISYDSQYAAVVWFSSDCYDCLEPSSTTGLQSTTSVSITSLPESTSAPLTTSTAPITTPYAVLSAAPYTSGVCSTQSVPGNQEPCAISGWPTPTSASGLLAIATGIPPAASGVYNFAESFEICANECSITEGCTLWAVDRGDWPSDMSDWSCLLYALDGRNYLLKTSPGPSYDRYAWSSDICYNCTHSEPVVSSSTVDATTGFTTTPFISSSPPATTLPPSSAVPTISAAPLVTSCNKPTAAQWYTNSCTISGVGTATSGLVAVATGVVPPVTGNYDFEPYYQQCASICAGISGCTGYALDRGNWPTDLSDWTCYFYGFNIATYLHGQTYSTNNRSVVWMNELCFDCPSSPVSSTTTSFIALPTSSTITSPPATSTSVAPACTRAASPDSSLSCNVRGFKEPDDPTQSLYVFSQADCAAYCSQLRDTDASSCSSYLWDATTSLCAVWDVDVWTAVGDDAVAGKSYKDIVLDDFGCWLCPSGAQVHAYPA